MWYNEVPVPSARGTIIEKDEKGTNRKKRACSEAGRWGKLGGCGYRNRAISQAGERYQVLLPPEYDY